MRESYRPWDMDFGTSTGRSVKTVAAHTCASDHGDVLPGTGLHLLEVSQTKMSLGKETCVSTTSMILIKTVYIQYPRQKHLRNNMKSLEVTS
jgi:hypothetical protein